MDSRYKELSAKRNWAKINLRRREPEVKQREKSSGLKLPRESKVENPRCRKTTSRSERDDKQPFGWQAHHLLPHLVPIRTEQPEAGWKKEPGNENEQHVEVACTGRITGGQVRHGLTRWRAVSGRQGN
jgi:hypothetical protein